MNYLFVVLLLTSLKIVKKQVKKIKKNGRRAFCRRLRCVIVVVVAFLLPFIAN